MSQRVLFVDDDAAILKAVKRALSGAGFDVDVAGSGALCLEKLKKNPVDCLLVDLGMPELDGFAVMAEALQESLTRSVIVVTGEGSIPIAVEAMRAGASDFITKPIDFEKLNAAIERTTGVPQGSPIDVEKRLAWRDQYAPGFVGQDPKMLSIFGIIERIADTECNVLVTGASGAGKELVARAVHAASNRRDKPFVAVNCAAIPGELMESEIFGHAKGAFTGAVEARQGKFQVADGGTLFLDEIGEMDMALQSKFLRVIQEREFTPVGETKPRKADVRIVSATNRDLLARAGEGHFREDLYYRLNVIPIQIPALHERPKDVTLLADFFIKRACKSYGRRTAGMDPEVSRILSRYNWPGNVRELENLIQRIVILKADEGPITRDDLPDEMVGRTASSSTDTSEVELPDEGIDIRKTLDALETRLTLEALKRCDGNKAKAAEMLGLKRTTLIERLKRLKLDKF
jgi:DNA-binding NtrC family response regulator